MWRGKLAQNAVCTWTSWNLVYTLWKMRKCTYNCLCSFTMFIHSFIHSIGMCRMRWFRAILRSFFHSSLLCTLSCHPSPPTILPSSLTPHLAVYFLVCLSNLVVPKFVYIIPFWEFHFLPFCVHAQTNVQTGPGAHSASYTMDTGSFPE